MQTNFYINKFKIAPLTTALIAVFTSFCTGAENYFNPAFFSDDPDAVADLSRFTNNGAQTPGTYRVDIYLNETFTGTRDVEFRESRDPKNHQLQPCLSVDYLQKIGINNKSPGFASIKDESCVDLSIAIPDAASEFEFEKLRLNLSIPQIALSNNARGYIPPEQWDEGINALLVNYNFSGSNSRDGSGESSGANSNYFLALNSGANIGPWRLRDNSTWSKSTTSSKWQHINTYLQRTVIPLKSELTIGDGYTSSELFDSLNFRGAQLSSDENMLPDSLKGFAPTIRGIAQSNAQVTVRQNNYIIYQTYVAPGAFEITDLYPTSSGGDLVVEVKESDGRISSYSVPYSAVPLLQREGRIKYSAIVGRSRTNSSQQEETDFGQFSLSWGLPHGWTLYGGGQLSSTYTASALGFGVNMGDFGAVSLDLTHAQSELADNSRHTGQSLRFLYAKSLNNIGTNFQLLGYRYSTSGFYTFSDTTYKKMDGYTSDPDDEDDDQPVWVNYYNLYYSKRGKVQVNISQQLNGYGSLYLSGSKQSYWHTDETNSLFQIGYNTQWHNMNIGLSYNYTQSPGQPNADQIVALNISLPLGWWLSPGGVSPTQRTNSMFATLSTSTDKDGHTTQNAGVSGSLLEANNLNYNLQQGYGNQGTGASGMASLDYKGAYGDVNVGYNYSDNGNYQQVNYGLSGGIVAHAAGITLSQPLGNTNILVAIPGAENVPVENNEGIKTDWRGYTVIPYANVYRQNRIALDINALGDDMDIDDAVVQVIPTHGALVRADFKARIGHRVLVTLKYHNKPVPFGATVTHDDTESSSIVGDDGVVYLAGLPPQGELNVQWGTGSDARCHATYALDVNAIRPVIKITARCI